MIALNYLLVSRELGRLNARKFLLASAAFLVFFIPVLVQLALKADQLLEFLGTAVTGSPTCPGTTTPRS